jgi:hypothetical protein
VAIKVNYFLSSVLGWSVGFPVRTLAIDQTRPFGAGSEEIKKGPKFDKKSALLRIVLQITMGVI